MKNSGIYALYWWNEDLVYVGLSQNLDARKREHINKLHNGKHSNYKVQKAFDTYGTPDFIVLELCDISELSNKEIYWTKEFDAMHQGLCIVEPGIVGFGPNSNSSKHSASTILKILCLLCKSNYSYKQIAERLKVTESLVSDIKLGKSHLWLKEAYPDKYKQMAQIVRGTQPSTKIIGHLINDSKEIFPVYSVKSFCKQIFGNETYAANISRVLSGQRKRCKGFMLLTT